MKKRQRRKIMDAGEIELQGEETIGVAVHLAAHMAALAGPHEVFVYRTVRDLVAGSGIEFEHQGAFELKGFPEEWQVFKVVKPEVVENNLSLLASRKTPISFANVI
jgi:class 3 adenylate cyclase